ncbi:tRNA-dihydrouridine synthase DusB [hydrothermal vent metagenome]|uniref:tRNA-dihydrouridine synthase DusB n=1 Tax=hydrothermal vent metagenome TaxID=652676 RepID=A0A3B0XKD4_9ZZZZ
MQLGPYSLLSPVFLAPMAGITDRPFRQLCRAMGAGLVVSEMMTSEPHLRNSRKTQQRMDHSGESGPISVQIAGAEASKMASAARYNVEHGAQIIDINMGCPAKKVCNVAAGSALMKDEKRVADILHAVVNAVDVPVTLKIRTGWDQQNKNAPQIARIAEDCGIQMLSVHGRTRADAYRGEVEYHTIAKVKQQITIPLVANGDITSPQKAQYIMQLTGADAVMIGRAAHGRPWIFREINHFLKTGKLLATPQINEIIQVLSQHLTTLYEFYGERRGVQIARKHISWYCTEYCHTQLVGYNEHLAAFRQHINKITDAEQQLEHVLLFLKQTTKNRPIAA